MRKGLSMAFCAFFVLLLAGRPALAETVVMDRTVACVDDDAILLSDLERSYQKAVLVSPGISRAEVLQTLINRTLLLREARKLFRETDEEQAIKDYVDLKVRAFIKVPEDEVRAFYDANSKNFGEVGFDKVKGQIETLLEEREVNKRLEDHLRDLRAKAFIRTFL